METIIKDVSTNKVFGEETDIQRGLIPIEDNPNEKIYLILYQYIDEDGNTSDDNRIWAIKQGRQDTYNHLRDLVVEEAIDPNVSYILAESVAMRDMGTVIGFLEAMLDNNLVDDETGFDPYDYDNESEE